jgi:hypothetical protein
MNYGVGFYDRDGEPIEWEQWSALWNDASYCHVAITAIDDDVGTYVSTVWMGLNHNLGEGPPLIFETMVFGGPLDQDAERYPTEAAAQAGHDRWVAAARHEAVHEHEHEQ